MIVNIISYKRDRYKKKTIGERIKKIDEIKKEKKREWIILWNVNGHGLRSMC